MAQDSIDKAAYRKLYEQSEKGKAAIKRKDQKRQASLGGRWENTIRQRVKYAVRIGRLTKTPCVDCGCLKVEAHHEDYSKPLVVIWVCRKCHLKRHGKKPI